MTYPGPVQHTVSFTLVHPEGSAAEQEFLATARTVLTGIAGVREFTVHRQVSPRSGFRFQFSMVFADEAAYRAYDAHPDHVGFVSSRWVPEVAAFAEQDFVAYGA
ncbi:Dabb family protein [Kineococcus sp. SYSU DK003]|uniref:Dabb family protein n=1 Tax=Kineococcus sp. SYSU DK003 TaxID=3383124 RepID=UPI003D7E1BBA